MRRDVFQALADPTRRSILSLLARRALTLNAIAHNFAISRPAVSKHIKILSECGLVRVRQEGRERYCDAKPEKLDEVSDWVTAYKNMWNERLDSLEAYLNELQSAENANGDPAISDHGKKDEKKKRKKHKHKRKN